MGINFKIHFVGVLSFFSISKQTKLCIAISLNNEHQTKYSICVNTE